MALLVDIKQPDWMSDDDMAAQLRALCPDADIRTAAAPGEPGEVSMLVVSSYLAGEALRYPDLRLLQKTGAGVEAILADAELPPAVRVARLPATASGPEMAEFALACVLQEQRHLRRYQAQQARAEWRPWPPRAAADARVAVLGLGQIGAVIARRFVDNGFPVSGWSRGPKRLPGIDCHAGNAGLDACLDGAAYVVCVLPSTPATRGLFDRDLFKRFGSGSVFINLGRGDLVVEADLLRALVRETPGYAILDVVSREPLPRDDPLWTHPRVLLTPHVSGFHLGDAVADIAENYRRLQRGDSLLNLVDRARGY